MNVLKITQTHKCFIVEFQAHKLYVLNQKALYRHLKHEACLDKEAIHSMQLVLSVEGKVEINLDYIQRSA